MIEKLFKDAADDVAFSCRRYSPTGTICSISPRPVSVEVDMLALGLSFFSAVFMQLY